MGEINWHISAIKAVKFMPLKFFDCLSSMQLYLKSYFLLMIVLCTEISVIKMTK